MFTDFVGQVSDYFIKFGLEYNIILLEEKT